MKSLSPNEDPNEEVFAYISDSVDGRAVSITPVDGVYKVICYDVSTTDPNIPTLKDEKQFDTMEESVAFAETWLA